MSEPRIKLTHRLLEAPVTRRSFVARSIALGLGASILAACGTDDDDMIDDDVDPVAEPADDDEPVDEPADDDEPIDEPADDDEPVDEPADDDERYGGSIRVGLYEEPATLDPHTTTSPPAGLIREHVYETLVELGDDLGLIPMLADNWDVNDDGTTYTFALRQEAAFHDGQPLSPDDVKFTFERILEISPRSGDYDVIEEIEEVDDHTVEFRLNTPSAPFIASLTQNFAHIAPRESSEEQIEADGAITTIIGTGPYEFVSYSAGQEVVIQRYEDYVPRDEPTNGTGGAKFAYIDQITFIPMEDETVRLLALETGDIDHMQQFPPAEFERIEAEGELNTRAEPGTDWGALYFNFARPPFDDLRMRQAVAHGVDWQQLADGVFWGHGVANNSFIPQVQDYWRTPYHDEMHDYDPDHARELLEDYGYDGEELAWWARDNYRDRTTAQLIQEMFRSIDLNVEIDMMDPAAFLDGIYIRRQDQTPEWPMVSTTASAFRADPDLHYYQRCHSSTHPGMYDNPEYDALVEEARTLTDDDERRELYEQCQRIVMEDIPVIIIFNAPYLDAYQPRLQDLVSIDPLAPFYWNVWIQE